MATSTNYVAFIGKVFYLQYFTCFHCVAFPKYKIGITPTIDFAAFIDYNYMKINDLTQSLPR